MFDSVETEQPNMCSGTGETYLAGSSIAIPNLVGELATGDQHAESVEHSPRTRPVDVGECMIPAEELLAPDDRVARLAGSRNLVDYSIVDMVADVIFSGEWCISGIHSEHHWVAYKLGITRRQAARLIAVAERRDELPYVFEQFEAGSLSLDQMFLIVRHCRIGFDETVAELAVNATIPQLRRIMRDHQFPDPDPKPEPKDDVDKEDGSESQPEHGSDQPDDVCPSDIPEGFDPSDLDKPYRGFSYGFDDDGSFRMWLRCGADDGAEIMAAMDQARAWLKADTGDLDASGFESFLAMMRAGQEADPSKARGADNRVVIHLDARDLDAWTRGLRPSLHLGPLLTREAMELLACDGSVQVVKYLFGRPVSLGLSQRLVTASLRRIILFRDNGCRFPGCSAQRWLDVHHITHWTAGGRTDTANLLTLCRRHHREHHRGAFSIAGNPDFGSDTPSSLGCLRFTARNGREITRLAPIPRVPPEGRYVHGSGEKFDSSLVHFPPNRAPDGRPRTWVPRSAHPVVTAEPCHPGAP